MSRKQRLRKEGFLKKTDEPKVDPPRKFAWWVAPLILFGSIILVYANGLNNEFVSDDIPAILRNPFVGRWGHFNSSGGPVQEVVHNLIVNLAGKQPFWFRLVNVLLHWGSAIWLFEFMSILSTSGLALAIAIIFAVHPLATEAVTWISGMPYAIYAFGCFLSLFLFSRNRGGKEKILGVIAYILVILSNQLAVVFPLVLAYWLFVNKQFKSRLGEWLVYLMIASIKAMVQLRQIGSRLSVLQAGNGQVSVEVNPLLQVPIAIASYLKLIFWPQALTLYHTELSFDFDVYLVALGVATGLFITMVYLIRKAPLISFGLGLFVISLLPALTPFGISWIVAERYAYFSFPGIIIASVLLADRLLLNKAPNWLKVGVLSVIVLLLGTRTVMRNFDWENQDTLWVATAKYSPSSAQNHNNLGDMYSRHGEPDKAVAEFETAIKLNPRYADAYHNLGNTYLSTGKLDEAESSYDKALKFNPKIWQSYAQLASIYARKGDWDKAKDIVSKGISISPNDSLLQMLEALDEASQVEGVR